MSDLWKKQRLLVKLATIILLTIFLTISVLYILLNHRMIQTTQENEEEHLLNIGRHFASQKIVIDALNIEETNEDLQNASLALSEHFDLDYAVVMTLESIRLTHPNEEEIYHKFQGGDEQIAFEGYEYTSIAEGTLGLSLRSFAPVYNQSQEIIGAVSLGITTQTLDELARANMQPLTMAFALSTALGLTLATIVAYSLKKQMHDMEPQEIARVLKERNAMMDHTKDAIFVTNLDGEVILLNQEAKKHFLKNGENGLKPITDILPFAMNISQNLRDANTEEDIYQLNEKNYIVSVAPIVVKEELVGNIFTLRDATELHMLTDQLYSTSAYANTLQSQSHDFLNKLHVIYGLTDLEDYEELKHYLQDLLEPEQEFSSRIAHLVHNPVIAGFLIGERRKFSEKQRDFTIEVYPDIPPTDDHRTIQRWIQLVQRINKFILENDGIKEIHIELGYFDKKLITTYNLKGNVDNFFQWINYSFDETFSITNGQNWLKLHFLQEYETDGAAK